MYDVRCVMRYCGRVVNSKQQSAMLIYRPFIHHHKLAFARGRIGFSFLPWSRLERQRNVQGHLYRKLTRQRKNPLLLHIMCVNFHSHSILSFSLERNTALAVFSASYFDFQYVWVYVYRWKHVLLPFNRHFGTTVTVRSNMTSDILGVYYKNTLLQLTAMLVAGVATTKVFLLLADVGYYIHTFSMAVINKWVATNVNVWLLTALHWQLLENQ